MKVSRILVVEDTPEMRQALVARLRRKGYVVTEDEDGDLALTRLESGEYFDVLITDLEMPRMSGLVLVVEIRKIPALQSMPIIMWTTLATSKGLAEETKDLRVFLANKNKGMQEIEEALQKIEGGFPPDSMSM